MNESPKCRRILFVCHGNICRSPMAEFVMKDCAQKAGLAQAFEIASAAVSSEELGNPVYGPVQRLLKKQGIDCAGKTARKIQASDYAHYDLLLGMDEANLVRMRRFFGGDPDGKIRRLMDYTKNPRDVADPWYTRDFDATWRDVTEGCAALLAALQ